jgi:hypothetical protein
MKTSEQRAKDELRRAKLRKIRGAPPYSGTPQLCAALKGLARDLSVGVHAETRKSFGGTIGLPEIAKAALANYDTQMSNNDLSKGLAGMADQSYLSKEVDGYSMKGGDFDEQEDPYDPSLSPCPTCGCSCGGAYSDELTLAANSSKVLYKKKPSDDPVPGGPTLRTAKSSVKDSVAEEYRSKAAHTDDRTLREGYLALAADADRRG